MDTFEILLNGLKAIPGLDNGNDRLLYPFKGSLEDDQRRFLCIPDQERIAYIRIRSCDVSSPDSLAITERGIYMRSINKGFFITFSDDKLNFSFEDYSDIKYSERKDSFYFPPSNDYIGRYYLVKDLNTSYRFDFAKVLDDAVKSVVGRADHLRNGMDLLENEKYEEALVSLNKAIELECSDHKREDDGILGLMFDFRGFCLTELGEAQDAKADFLIARELISKSSNPDVQKQLPDVLVGLAEVTDSRIEKHKLLTEAFDKSSDFEEKKHIMQELNSLHASSEFKDVFASRESIAERKVLLAVKNDSQPIPGQTVMCLERSVLHSLGVSFPLGHPVDGVAYVAHPTRSNYYVPMNEYEDIIFLEKVNEYCYLLQCLGAKEIDITRLSGKSLSEMKKSGESGEASLGYKLSKFEGKAENGSQSNSDYSKTSEYKSHLSFNPSRKPFVPKDLNWLAIEPRWSRLIDNRLHGNLQHYVEEISTSEDKMLSSSEETEVAAEIKALGARFKGCIKSNDSMSSSSKETTTWQISVKF